MEGEIQMALCAISLLVMSDNRYYVNIQTCFQTTQPFRQPLKLRHRPLLTQQIL